MNTNQKPLSTGTARLQLALVSVLSIVGLAAAVRPYNGFSSGDIVAVPGLGQRTPVELALLALRVASGLFALWLLTSIVASLVNLLRARSNASTTTRRKTQPAVNSTRSSKAPRLFGPGWLQQLLRQAAGGTLALALLAGPASAVTRSPQSGTARTALAPVASILANHSAAPSAAPTETVQFAGDVTTGQRWPVLPVIETTTETTVETAPQPTDTTKATETRPTTEPPRATNTATSTPRSTPSTEPFSTLQPTTTFPARLASPTAPPSTNIARPSRSQVPITSSDAGASDRGILRTPTVLPSTTSETTSPTTTSATIAATPSHSVTNNPTVRPATTEPARTTRSTHVVKPGESFWSIAEQHVLAAKAHADDHDIARYWEVLQATNLDRLPAAGVPDLLFPGTELVLPPIPPLAG